MERQKTENKNARSSLKHPSQGPSESRSNQCKVKVISSFTWIAFPGTWEETMRVVNWSTAATLVLFAPHSYTRWPQQALNGRSVWIIFQGVQVKQEHLSFHCLYVN